MLSLKIGISSSTLFGSVGLIVWEDGIWKGLTCAHVFVGKDQTPVLGLAVEGHLESGTVSIGKIIEVNTSLDFALFSIENIEWRMAAQATLGEVGSILRPKTGFMVAKKGAVSGLTVGRISATAGWFSFTILPRERKKGANLSMRGDSGSVVFLDDPAGIQAIGMIYAGDDDEDQIQEYALCLSLSKIEDARGRSFILPAKAL